MEVQQVDAMLILRVRMVQGRVISGAVFRIAGAEGAPDFAIERMA